MEKWFGKSRKSDPPTASEMRECWRRPTPGPARGSGTPALRAVELWDLVSAFGRLMRETLANQPQAVVVDQTPLHVYVEQVLARLSAEGRLPFSALFTPPHTRPRLVGLFLAVLELAKARRIVPEQAEPFGEIWVALAPEAGQGEVSAGGSPGPSADPHSAGGGALTATGS